MKERKPNIQRSGHRRSLSAAALNILLCSLCGLHAQLVDRTMSPNILNEGIGKSLADEIGVGSGDIYTANSAAFNIARDPFRAIRRGRQIFQRKFVAAQGFGPRTFGGLGDMNTVLALGAGLVDSCAGCHGRPRGSAGFGGNVVTRPDSRNAPHLFGLGLKEMLADEITADLRALRSQAIDSAQQTAHDATVVLVSKGINYGKLTARPDGSVDTRGVRGINGDLRVRPFFAHGQTISIREFVVGALRDEMGLQAVDPDLAAAQAGARFVTPAGMVLDGSQDQIAGAPTADPLSDLDADGVPNEIPASLVDYLEFYLLNYFKPATYEKTLQTTLGRQIFDQIGCGQCHVPNLTINHDRRVADVETAFDPAKHGFNGLFATAKLLLNTSNDVAGLPPLKIPQGGSFVVSNVFTDFKRHDLGPNFYERNYDGTVRTEFLTKPLWGVGSTAPYGHDGRSINLSEVILRHGGEALGSSQAFERLPDIQRGALVAFLQSLVLFPPDDTSSNLNPGDPATPGWPQFGHGSIKLSVLFNDPIDPE
jgi:mono/diheme cytochrome c family protein